MFIFEKSLPEHLVIEKEIINLDAFFNMVSKGKEAFSTEEVLEEINNLQISKIAFRSQRGWEGIYCF